MRILWMCNVVLPSFCDEFDIKRTNIGGWMSGMLAILEDVKGIEIALAFPVRDEWRLKNGIANGHRFFSFNNEHNDIYILRDQRKNRLRDIIFEYNPDIIHIWGTEYPWALETVEICGEAGCLDRVFVHIQGLVSNYAKHYLSGIPMEYTRIVGENGKTIKDGKLDFEKRGENEMRLIGMVKHVGTRTYWDKACCRAINHDCNLFTSSEVLREEFYNSTKSWKYSDIEPHTIFVSQASYPIKGFHYLIEALNIVVRDFPDVTVFVGGISPIQLKPMTSYGSFLRSMIAKYNLKDNIVFCGKLNVEEMIKKYRHSNVFVSPSCIENSSNSVLEAMMVGIPVVSSYVGGLTSFMRNRENSLTYPENETDLLAYHIMECFRDRELCERISRGGVETANCVVSIDKGKDEILKIYETINNNSSKGNSVGE